MPFFFLLPDKHIGEYPKFIGLFLSQKMPDDILRLILLATMVERKDDELQAGGMNNVPCFPETAEARNLNLIDAIELHLFKFRICSTFGS